MFPRLFGNLAAPGPSTDHDVRKLSDPSTTHRRSTGVTRTSIVERAVSITALEATPFIGRQRELGELHRALGIARAVTLIGVGGTGKTRLAQSLLHELRDEHEGRVWIVELGQVHDPAMVQLAVAAALGLRPEPGGAQAPTVARFLGDDPALLVLDNCEHLLEPVAAMASELLASCPRLRLVATSREALGIAGELVYRLSPMAVPELPDGLRAEDLLENESVALFVGRAREALPGFELTDANEETVARLCVALEGIPLALELAAARIRVLSPEAMLDRIEQRFQLLSRGYVDVPDRQRSMEASVEWSHDLCGPQEQALWARLSVFSGGFDLDAAEIVCADDTMPAADVLDALSSLVDKSLLSRDPQDAATHFFMLETIREYGALRLDLTGETELWEGRHRDYFAQRTRAFRQQWVGPDQPRLVAVMRRNHANLRAVLERTTRSKEQAAVALRIAVDLEGYWVVTGLLTEARRWLESALTQGIGTSPERAVALSISGYLAGLQVKLDEAGQRIAAARAELGSSAGAPDTVAWARLHFAEAMQSLYRGDLTAAERSCRRSIELLEAAGDVHGLPAAYVVLGVCLSAGGREVEAAAAHARCLAITEARGERHIRGLALWALSVDARRSGDLARAAGLASLSLDLRSQLGDDAGVALALESMASISAAQGDAVRSATLLGAAAQLWERVGLGPLAGQYIAEQRDLGERGARQQLDLLTFEAAHRRGLSMPVEQAVDYALGRSPAVEQVDLEDTPLTARERQVTALIGEGLSNRQIASRLVISVRTAQGHVENILRKLGFRSRTQVAAWVVSRSVGARR